MELSIEGTRVTPTISFQKNENVLCFTGRSSPENSIEFFRPVFDFINLYSESDQSILIVNVALEYFNTSSTKVLYNILNKLSEMQDTTGKVVVINWFYEEWDEDMFEVGEDFSQSLNLKFNLKEIEDLEKDLQSSAVAA
jgi:hypothetical protein